jgi:hypothetical protein
MGGITARATRASGACRARLGHSSSSLLRRGRSCAGAHKPPQRHLRWIKRSVGSYALIGSNAPSYQRYVRQACLAHTLCN